MDTTDLKLFYDIPQNSTKTTITLTCEECKEYNNVPNKVPKIEHPPQSNNNSYLNLLKFVAIVLFMEPFYKNF